MESSKGFFRGSLAVPWKKLDFHSHFDGSSSFFGLETAGNRNQLPVRFVQPLWAFLVSWMMTWQVMETKATFEFAENTRIGQLNFTQSGWARLRWYPALIPHHFIGVASNLLWPSLILLHFDSFFAHVLLTKGPGTLSVRIFSRTGYEETKWVLDSNHTSQKHHFLDKCWFIPHERRPILLFFFLWPRSCGFSSCFWPRIHAQVDSGWASPLRRPGANISAGWKGYFGLPKWPKHLGDLDLFHKLPSKHVVW